MQLQLQCENDSFDSLIFKKNQFFRNLAFLNETTNKSRPREGDQLLLYRDALMAATYHNVPLPKLAFPNRVKLEKLKKFGLDQNEDFSLSLGISVSDLDLDLSSVYRQEKKRKLKEVAIDTQVKKLLPDEFTQYNGRAQRMAVWCTLSLDKSPISKNLIVNLPTGCGKTLLPHSLASKYHSDREAKTIVVIVPTLSLIIDLESRTKEFFGKIASFDHGGVYRWDNSSSDYDKADIKQRVLSGEQGMLFITPETFSNQRNTFFDAASSGKLGHIFVDEAHMIVQWGTAFRPAFQILAALVNTIRRQSPYPVHCVLMSATINQNIFDQLSLIFKHKKTEVLSLNGSYLRPEIQYNVKQSEDFNKKINSTIDAVIALPKPLIVYCTTKETVEYLRKTIRSELDVDCLEVYTGDTVKIDRERVLQDWKKNFTQIIVATSAFGLGVDKPNVRSVLHAEIPENMDRFYQEVGRSGRDGFASQSLMIFTRADFSTAKSINESSRIKEKLGWARWEELLKFPLEKKEGSRIVDVSRKHTGVKRDGSHNVDWNWNTMTLMQRSGLLDIRALPYVGIDSDLSAGESEVLTQRVEIEFLKDNPLDPDHWRDVDETRNREIDLEKQGFSILERWLNDGANSPLCAEFGKYFKYEYRHPEDACGGCPGCEVGRETLVGLDFDLKVYKGTESQHDEYSVSYFHFDEPDNERLVYEKLEDRLLRFVKTQNLPVLIVANLEILKIVSEQDLLKKILWFSCPLDDYSHFKRRVSDNFWKVIMIYTKNDQFESISSISNFQTTVLADESLKDPVFRNRSWIVAAKANPISSWEV